ncbi:hypothetical protein [Actinocrispum sp. NPDC049592]|uniref:hypothetical protein n=1 Tax=Actinocrispum sp. NPDC049592 TaxID=3154835 RepID=UPI00342ED188
MNPDDQLTKFRDDIPEMTEAAFHQGKARLQARTGKTPKLWLVAAAVVVVTIGAAALNNRTTTPAAHALYLYLYMDEQQYGTPVPGAQGDLITSTIGGDNVGYWRMWIPSDRTQTWRLSRDVRTGTPDGPLPADPPLPHLVSGLSKWEGTFEAPNGDFFPMKGNWLEPTEAFVNALPRTPTELNEKITNEVLGPPSAVIDAVEAVLAHPAPKDLRTALYAALKTRPEVKETTAKTRDGRPATSYAITDNPADPKNATTHELLADPETGDLIGTRITGFTTQETVIHWTEVNALGATS